MHDSHHASPHPSMMIIMLERPNLLPLKDSLPMATSNPTPSPKGTAVVTGASAGIGKTYAQRLAARGYDLLLVARRAGRLEALAQPLPRDHGIRVDVLPADLADPAELERVAQRLEGDDRVTMLVNNAGVSTF